MGAITNFIQTSSGANDLLYMCVGNGVSLSINLALPIPVTNSGSPITIGTDPYPEMCVLQGGSSPVTYLFSGQPFPFGYWKVTGASAVGLTASTGELPSNISLCCIYNKRLVISGNSDAPNIIYASRIGDDTDWDESQPDASGALAIAMDDSVVALIPTVNDYLVVGCRHSIYRWTGDPKVGGRVDLITNRMSILGPRAWCQDPSGDIWFASRAGLCKMNGAASDLQLISATKLADPFADFPGTPPIKLVYDSKRHLVWVFNARRYSGGDSLSHFHLVYDVRNGALWEQQFMSDTIGPHSSLVYETGNPDDYALLLGGGDGYMRRYDESYLSDDGTAISSYAFIGPFEPAGDATEAKMIDLEATLGESVTAFFGDGDWNLDFQIRCGDDPYTAYADPQMTRTSTWTEPRHQPRFATRLTARTFFLKLSNSTLNKTWSADRFVGRFTVAGSGDMLASQL